jgi:hypothetical protein
MTGAIFEKLVDIIKIIFNNEKMSLGNFNFVLSGEEIIISRGSNLVELSIIKFGSHGIIINLKMRLNEGKEIEAINNSYLFFPPNNLHIALEAKDPVEQSLETFIREMIFEMREVKL